MNRKKILVVDDDAVILKTLTTKLYVQGYEVSTATDGSSAVSNVRRTKPDLILLDINLPVDVGMDWNAFSIMEWLKRMEDLGKTPIIVISGGDPKKSQERSLSAGALAFFHKPINHDELIKFIRKTLGDDSSPPQVVKV